MRVRVGRAARAGRRGGPAASLAAAVALCWAGAAAADGVADRFATAPDAMADQRQLVQVTLNGLDRGVHAVVVSQGRVALPAETLRALRIAADGAAPPPLPLREGGPIASRFDPAAATLDLSVPASDLQAQHFAPDSDAAEVRLSPEAWGTYLDYDVNVRRVLGRAGGAGRGGSAPAAWGGIAELRLVAPDVIGGFGWAYDSERRAGGAVVRLDSTLIWRPAALGLAASVGDAVSTGAGALAATRPYRFFGLRVGTDYSGAPGWSSAPVASVTGSAQAQSAIDVFLNGQRAYGGVTPGGPFSVTLPPGAAGAGTSVVVTDVTGRSVVLPVEAPRVDARVLRRGVFLWSAGLGAPRFGYGSARSSHAPRPYGYADARYGAFDAATLRAHAEVGPGLVEVEAGADAALTPALAVRGSVAASRSSRGVGAAGRFGVSVSGPWGFALEAALAGTVGRFEDVVSASGRADAARNRFDASFTRPARSEASARLSWQAAPALGLSASYQAVRYPGAGTVGIVSLGGTYLAGTVPLFANVFHDLGGRRSTTVVAGLSVQFGAVQASASAGYGTGGGRGGGVTGNLAVSRPLGEDVGSVGWNAYAARAPGGTFANADAQLRTGRGVAGLAVQSFGRATTGVATLRGTAGLVGWHPFLSDPAQGGLIVVDADRAGVPVQLNGYDKGRTWFDGKLALPGAVAGVPQRVAIDAGRMPIEAVPDETDRQATVREGGATVVPFAVRSASAAATLDVSFRGEPPPVGSTLVSATAAVPIGKEGRAHLPAIARGEVLRVEMPDGLTCLVRTDFDGRGGLGRRLGILPCEEAR